MEGSRDAADTGMSTLAGGRGHWPDTDLIPLHYFLPLKKKKKDACPSEKQGNLYLPGVQPGGSVTHACISVFGFFSITGYCKLWSLVSCATQRALACPLCLCSGVCVCVCPSQTLICPPLFPFADYKLPERLFLFCPFLGAALPTGNPPLHHLILRAGNLGTCPMRAVAWPSLGRLPWAPNPPAPGWGPRFPEWTQRDVLWPELGLQDPLGLTLPPRSRAPTLGSGISVPEDNPPPPPPAVAMLFGSTPRCTEASAPGKLCPKVTRRPSSWRGAFLSLAGSRETVI